MFLKQTVWLEKFETFGGALMKLRPVRTLHWKVCCYPGTVIETDAVHKSEVGKF